MRHVKAHIAAFWWHTAPAAAMLGAVLLASPAALAQQLECGDRAFSPYFFVKSEDPSLDQLTLKRWSSPPACT